MRGSSSSNTVQGLAGNFWSLLAGRAVFGVAFALAWTAGLAFLSESSVRRRSAVLGRSN
jgi:predicted MFS family arabinose efflux permease